MNGYYQSRNERKGGKMNKEMIDKCIEALGAAIEMNGSRYALMRMAFVRMQLKKEKGEENEQHL